MPSLAPRAVEEDTPDQTYLRGCVEEYDELLEVCMTRVLTGDEQHILNELHGLLLLEEYFRWEGCSDRFIANLIGWLDSDFPMVRYELGMLPSDN